LPRIYVALFVLCMTCEIVHSKGFNCVREYLGTTVTNQNLIQEEIKRRLNSESGCYCSVQNLLSFSLLLKNVNSRIFKTVILPVVLYGCEAWSLTVKETN
jgi:hypothetical protein